MACDKAGLDYFTNNKDVVIDAISSAAGITGTEEKIRSIKDQLIRKTKTSSIECDESEEYYTWLGRDPKLCHPSCLDNSYKTQGLSYVDCFMCNKQMPTSFTQGHIQWRLHRICACVKSE